MRPARTSTAPRRTLAALLTAFALAVSQAASPDDVCKRTWESLPDDSSKLRKLLKDDCLGGSSDTSLHVADLRSAIQLLPELEDTSRLRNALDVLGTVHSYLVPEVSAAISKDCRDAILGGVVAINDALLHGQLTPVADLSCVGASELLYKASCWELDSSTSPPVVPGLAKCGLDVHDRSSLEGAAAVIRLATVVQDVLGGVFAPLLSQYHADATELRGRWWTYFHLTRGQYPWELLVNAALFGRTMEKSHGQFHSPPTHQWVLVHPDAALEYLHDASDGEQFKPTLSVELVGINCWRWKNEKAARAIGGAVVANYSDVASIRDWRFGGVIHVAHRYSFGVTRGSGETGYFVSADVAAFALDKQKKAKQFLEQLKSAH